MKKVIINGAEYMVLDEKRGSDLWPHVAKNWAERGIVAEYIVRFPRGQKQWLAREYKNGAMQIVVSIS